MAQITHLECTACGARYPAGQLMQLCPADGRPLMIRLDLVPGRVAHSSLHDRRDMWRYGPLLPLDPARPDDADCIVPIGGGGTPLREDTHSPVAAAGGFRLYVKEEGSMAGGNPTGSFKDRGMAMAVAMARQFGLKRLVVPTQGNAGDALVEYAAAAGFEVAVVMPGDTPTPIRDRVARAAEINSNVTLDLVQGTIREAGALARDRYVDKGWFSVATFVEPGWRIEGKKTLGLEISEALQPASGSGPGEKGAPNAPWGLPDVIVYPTGGGTGILGMFKAFEELQYLGWTRDPMPRFVCIQSDQTDPLVRAWDSGADDTQATDAGATVAVGLNVPGGVGHFRVLQIVRRSGGHVLAMPEQEIVEASRALASQGFGPEGAACMASLDRLVDIGQVRAGDRVVVVNTCGPDKYDPV